ncbi:MAG TPA: diguanylate cyclase [Acetobacteraceae bacterium]|nr:diguanylate cyclase [Acetobacteraceae bacterium]
MGLPSARRAMTARVLLVSGVPDHARLLKARLAAEHYQVASARTGAEALRLSGEWRPDIVLLDTTLAGMDGSEVCERLKTDPTVSHIPVVMVTSRDETAERARALAAGVDDFLSKPVAFDTLLARLRGLVRLKRLLDEWRARAETAHLLGLADGSVELPAIAGTQVLVVNDGALEGRSLAASLACEGLTSVIARNEAEMQAMTAINSFDLIVLNLSLAGGNSLAQALRLRASQQTQDVPLLLIADCDEHIVCGFDLGANDWLSRPVEVNEFRARARNQIRRRLYQQRLRASLDQGLAPAIGDPLTGLYNHRYVLQHLHTLLGAASGHNLAVLMIDLDHFKRINSNYGPLAGDQALRAVAATLRANLRVVDTLARYGGEEFVALMPGTSLGEATGAGERLRDAVAGMRFSPAGQSQPHRLTVSIGVAASADASVTSERLLELADRALVRAKHNGRNRVEVACAD